MAGSLPVGMQQHLPVDRGRWSAVVGGFLSWLTPPVEAEKTGEARQGGLWLSAVMIATSYWAGRADRAPWGAAVVGGSMVGWAVPGPR